MAIASLSILGILGMSIERFVNFERHFLNITHNSKSYICNDWVCTNDFIFTVVLVLNTGETNILVTIFLTLICNASMA